MATFDPVKTKLDIAGKSVKKRDKARSHLWETSESNVDLGALLAREETKSAPFSTAVSNGEFPDTPKEEEPWFSRALNTPVIKGAINVLSTGAYVQGNQVANVIDGVENAFNKIAKGENAVGAVAGSLGEIAGGILPAIGKGLSAGIGQNPNDAVLQHDNIDRLTDALGIATGYTERTGQKASDTDAGKWLAGVGGFVGDVALDPLTYAGGGAISAATKGAIKGTREAGIAGKMAKRGDELSEGLTTSRSKGAIEGAKKELTQRRVDIIEQAHLKDTQRTVNRRLRKDPNFKIQDAEGVIKGFKHLPENLLSGETKKLSMKDMVAASRKETETTKLVETLTQNAAKGLPDDVARVIDDFDADVQPTIHQNPTVQANEVIDEIPSARTVEEVAIDTPAPKANKSSIPDAEVKVAEKAIVDDIPSELKIADYANVTPVDRFVLATEKLSTMRPKYALRVQKNITNYVNSVADPMMLDTAKLKALGLKDDDFGDLILHGNVDNIMKKSGDMRYIFRDMAAGNLPPQMESKYLNFANDFFGEEFADAATAAKAGLNYIKENSGAIKKSVDSYKPTADVTSRMFGMPGVKSDSIALLRSLPENEAAQFRKILEPEEAEAYFVDALRNAELRTLNGVMPAETEEVFEKILNQHLKEYSTPVGAFRTNRGFSTASENIADGGAKIETLWTSNAQLDLFRNVSREVSAVLKGKNLGNKYVATKDAIVMQVLERSDVLMKSHGVFGYMTNLMPDGGTAIRASLFDVMDSMTPGMRKKYIWTRRNHIDNLLPTQVADVLETIGRSIISAGPDGSVDILKLRPEAIKVLKGKFNDDKTVITVIERNLNDNVMAFNKRVVEANVALVNVLGRRNAVYNSFYNELVKLGGAEKFATKVLKNTSLSGTHLGKELIEASTSRLQELTGALDAGDHSLMRQILLSDIPKFKQAPEIDSLVQSAQRNVDNAFATPKEQVLNHAVTDVMKASTPKGIAHSKAVLMAEDTVKNAKKLKANGERVGMRATNHKTAALLAEVKRARETAVANAKLSERISNPQLHPDAVAKELIDDTVDTVDNVIHLNRTDHAFQAVHRRYPFQNFFNRTFGMSISYPQITTGLHTGIHLETAFQGALNEFAKKFPDTSLIKETFAGLQKLDDLAPALAGEMGDASQSMARILQEMFDPNSNFFIRNGVSAPHFKSILEGQGVPKKWLEFASDSTPQELAAMWKVWQGVDNPLGALSTVHRAMIKASDDITMGATYSEKFGMKKPPVGKESDYAKIKWEGDGSNAFFKLIDQNLFYPKEIIAELPALGNMITESRTFGNKTFARYIKIFDNLTSALKITQTTMKPGHHVMNIQGDLLRNMLATGGKMGMEEYTQIIKMTTARRRGINELSAVENYERVGAIAKGYSINSKGPTVAFNSIGGKPLNISEQTLNDAFETSGIYITAHGGGVMEDLLEVPGTDRVLNMNRDKSMLSRAEGASEKLNEGVSGLVNNRFIKMNKFSAERDNIMRGALALHFMKSRNFKSFDEAVEYASTQVKKWAPLAKDFTAAESKSARRIIFYYTWLRGILPRVMESAIVYPGVAMVPSKASYNFAVANGVDPISLGDPFPEDQMIPSYYREQVLGPQWMDDNGDYFGLNPTSPVLDVMNSLGSGASIGGFAKDPFAEGSSVRSLGQTVMGMLHPALKAGPELMMGKSMSTNAPIKDSGQYFTDMVGPARFGSKIVGHTVSPLNGGIPRRTEAKYKNGIGDSQEWWDNALFETGNYLTGSQTKNFTSDQAEKSAQFEEKAKLSKEAKSDPRVEWWNN